MWKEDCNYYIFSLLQFDFIIDDLHLLLTLFLTKLFSYKSDDIEPGSGCDIMAFKMMFS